jgi:hypothetical protein
MDNGQAFRLKQKIKELVNLSPMQSEVLEELDTKVSQAAQFYGD